MEPDSDLPASAKEVAISLPVSLYQGPNENLAVFKNTGDIEFLNAVTGNLQKSISYSTSKLEDFQFGPEH
jgi:hypothetical protein